MRCPDSKDGPSEAVSRFFAATTRCVAGLYVLYRSVKVASVTSISMVGTGSMASGSR